MPVTKHWEYQNEIVTASLKGLCNANPDLKFIESERVVYSESTSDDKVAILSGGGSGHEPLHAGFVGKGGIDVVAAGYIFASPSSKQIYTGLKAKQTKKGTLIVVKNYTGDILHFGLAAERIKAEGYPVEVVIVQDDVAVGRTKNGMVGRRGLSGTAFIHKIAGAKSAKDSNKATLKELHEFVEKVNKNLVTIGASLDHVVIPRNKASKENKNDDGDEDDKFEFLKADQIEIGMGIHNEAGVEQVSPIPSIEALVPQLLKYLLDKDDVERNYVDFDKDDEVALMINNLGSTSNLELYAIQNAAYESLSGIYGLKPVRTYTGTYTTSLDGQGFSITLLNITKAGGKEVLDCLDYPTAISGWNSSHAPSSWVSGSHDGPVVEVPDFGNESVTSTVTFNPKTYVSILEKGAKNALTKKEKITLYDTVAGDGDCGEILANGCNAVLKLIADNKLELNDAIKSLTQLTDVIETAMGGTSGGLYSIYVSALGKSLRAKEQKDGPFEVTLDVLADTLKDALESLYRYTRARVGDRTLIDTLAPFAETLKKSKDINLAKKSAEEGSDATRAMKPKFGRATYVSDEELAQFKDEGGLPDPGAFGLAALIEGMIDGYKS